MPEPNRGFSGLTQAQSKVLANCPMCLQPLTLPVSKSSSAMRNTEQDIDLAFDHFIEQRADAPLVASEPFFTFRRAQIVALARQHSLPTMYQGRGDAEAGGLMSLRASIPDMYRQAGGYVGRILKGAKPSDLPVQQPTKFEFVINLRTARSLGIEVPQNLLALADEVIE